MSTVHETWAEASDYIGRASACLERIAQAPRPSAARHERIRKLQTEAKKIQREFEDYKEHKTVAEHASVNAAHYKLAEAQAALKEVQAKKSGKSGAELTSINVAMQKLQEDISALNQTVSTSRAALVDAERTVMDSEADDAVIGLFERAKHLLTDSGKLEEEVQLEAAVDARAASDFAEKTEHFKNAEGFHNTQANRMFWAMLALLVLAAITIYLTFIMPPASAPHGNEPRAAIIERAIQTGVGKVSILLFLAWGLRYFGSLHKSHAEQSILYRDRNAALGVAASLLESSPSLHDRQELLKSLTRGYLDFDQNAFRIVKQKPKHTDVSLDQVREAVDIIHPILNTRRENDDETKRTKKT